MTALVRLSPASWLSLMLSMILLVQPTWGSSAIGGGMIVSAYGANVGTAGATVGSTLFDGDSLETAPQGSLQIRAGAAEVLLTSSSHLVWGSQDGMPEVVLAGGTAVFSTASAKAFALRASKAVFRPRDGAPTVASVTLLNPKELIVKCSRGAVTIAVEDDVRVIPEGSAYRVVLDANTPPMAELRGWGGSPQGQRKRRKKFIWYAIAFTTSVTAIAVWKALESPDRPK
jgi:hypothetical protein